ncbi:hypothetical protein BJX66DRAFT_293421 [Aspergillus keveii]|uniref:Uncharacterized protein n=1 Tax=Aspergillus keveii TaxID=714993 RepID=A0ABR4GJM1_9EURO
MRRWELKIDTCCAAGLFLSFFFFVWHIARVGVCNTHGLAICFVLVHPQGIKSLGVISCIIC